MRDLDFGEEPSEIASPKGDSMKKKKPARKKAYLDRINIKMKPEELKAIQAKADRYTGGNISAWLRLAGLKYVPVKK